MKPYVNVFVGFDNDGDACLYLQRRNEDGGYDFLGEEELTGIAGDLESRLNEEE